MLTNRDLLRLGIILVFTELTLVAVCWWCGPNFVVYVHFATTPWLLNSNFNKWYGDVCMIVIVYVHCVYIYILQLHFCACANDASSLMKTTVCLLLLDVSPSNLAWQDQCSAFGYLAAFFCNFVFEVRKVAHVLCEFWYSVTHYGLVSSSHGFISGICSHLYCDSSFRYLFLVFSL